MPIEIRAASNSELEDIQGLFRKMFEIFHVDQNIEYPYTEDGRSYLENCIQQQIALVAKDREETIGFLTGGIEDTLPFKTYRKQGHIHNLFVLEAYRKQGTGRRLIQRFIQICSDSDVQRIVTDSDDEEALRRFYGELGFRITSVNYEMDSSNL